LFVLQLQFSATNTAAKVGPTSATRLPDNAGLKPWQIGQPSGGLGASAWWRGD
jgi:hypothetical protein